ncbi:MAG: YebC/PmpR family DNA-binding transcriptional regulator [Ruminococcaceae bacterium]|nr:YebC/PmpR family DNA-binding transcriptional regulator [Oscillospiraceae bacterium]
MSGHSKWKNIMHKKEKTDAQKAKIFTKIGKEMSIAVKAGGPDPSVNAKLAALIAKAKANNVPNDNIERTIKKASSSDAANLEEMRYEGYGPGGVAVIVEAATDNTNRTTPEVRSYFSKYKGNLGTTGCVGYLFEEKGVIMISKEEGYDEDALMEAALEAGAEDFVSDEDAYIIYTETSDLASVAEAIEGAGFKYVSAEEDKIPSTYVTLTSEDDIKYMNLLIEHLEDNDDVTEVYHNWENCD